MNYQFPRGRFDFDSHVFVVDGAERSIVGNSASLLRLLVQNRDRVVTHSEIGLTLAEGEAYVRTYVSTHVKRLRDALGDHDFVRTVPRQGYQWIETPGADVRPGSLPLASAPDESSDNTGAAAPLETIAAFNAAAEPSPRVSVSLPVLGQLLVLGGAGILLREVADSPHGVAGGAITALLLITGLLFTRSHDRLPRQAARSLANALTYARPGLGVAAGFEMASGDSELALWWYLAGLASDVADGAVARLARVESTAGRDWDAMSDAFMNGAFGLGLGSVALRSSNGPSQILLLSALVLVFATTRSQAHTILDKCLSGFWRVVLFTLGLALVAPGARAELAMAGAVGAGLACLYEGFVLWNDWTTGKRPLMRIGGRPALVALRSDGGTTVER